MGLILIVASIVVILWMLIGIKSEPQRRGSDYVSPKQRRLMQNAKEAYDLGDPRRAAAMLESGGMLREAVNIYERSGLIHEAAQALIRHGKVHRAGVMYFRHGKYPEAFASFSASGTHREAGDAAVQCQWWARAAQSFMRAGETLQAAQCYERCEEWRSATKAYFDAGDTLRAINCLVKGIGHPENLTQVHLSEEEKDLILNAKMPLPTLLVDLAGAYGLLAKLIIAAVERGDELEAHRLYLRSPQDISSQLWGLVQTAPQPFARLLKRLAIPSMLGRFYELTERYEDAASAFEQAGELEAAIKCWRQAGFPERAKGLKLRIPEFHMDDDVRTAVLTTAWRHPSIDDEKLSALLRELTGTNPEEETLNIGLGTFRTLSGHLVHDPVWGGGFGESNPLAFNVLESAHVYPIPARSLRRLANEREIDLMPIVLAALQTQQAISDFQDNEVDQKIAS